LKFEISKEESISYTFFLNEISSVLPFLRDDSNILACIPTTNIFIEAGLDHGGVLVHCFGGKSRSPAFIAAYLMSSRSWSFEQAYSVIKTIRPAAEINLGFECQLRAYHASNYDVYVAQQILLRTRIRDLHFLKESTISPAKSATLTPIITPIRTMNLDTKTEDSTEMNIANTPNATADSIHSTNVATNTNILPANLPIHEWFAQNMIQTEHSHDNPNDDNGAAKRLGMHDSFTCAPKDEQGNLIAANIILAANDAAQQQQHRNKRSLSNAQEHLPVLEALLPTVHADDDMEVVTDVEESISSLRTPVPKSNASSHHSQFTNGGGGKGVNSSQNSSVLEESIDSAVSLMSTDPNNMNNTSRPNSSSSRRPLALLPSNLMASTISAPPTFSVQRNALQLGNLNLNSAPAPLTESQQAQFQFQPALLNTNRSMTLGSSSQGNITRRAKAAKNRSSFGSASATITSGSLPTTTTPEIGTKNPSCHLSRPGSNWVRVIPPLRGLEREFKCSWCNIALFQLANVIRIDLNMNEMLKNFYDSLEKMNNSNSSTNSSGFGMKEDELAKQFMINQQHGGLQTSANHNHKTASFTFNNTQQPDSNVVVEPAIEIITPRGKSTSSFFKPTTILPPISGMKNNGGSTKNLFSVPNSLEMDVEEHQQHQNNNNNHVHYSSSFKEPSSHNNSFGFKNDDEDSNHFSVPLTTSKAANSRNKGFTFDMMDSGPPPQNHNKSGVGLSLGIASSSSPFPSSSENNAATNSVFFKATNSSTNTPRSMNLTTPRRLPSLDTNTVTGSGGAGGVNLESPRTLTGPPPMKRQGSSNSATANHMLSSSNQGAGVFNPPTTVVSKVPTLPSAASRKSLVPAGNTSLGPPYPNNSLVIDDSPRLMIPPHRQQEILSQQGVINPDDYASLANPNPKPVDRPKSAEKRRWLARIHLLNETPTSSNKNAVHSMTETKIMDLADADEVASSVALNNEKYYYIEYMDWMGKEIFKANCPSGNIICPSCKNMVGNWYWTPSERMLLEKRLEAPLFRIHKHVVHHVSPTWFLFF
jgi:hypothetical protein